MNLSLSQLETELIAHLGVDITDFPNGMTDVDLLLNRSWWDLSDKFKFREKEASVVFPTVVGTRNYSVATLVSPLIFDSIRLAAIEDPVTFQHTPLDKMTIDSYEALYNSSSNEYAKPSNYIRDGSNLILFPTPDQVYNITMYYRQTLADIANTGVPVPESWHEIVLYGALWRGFMRFGDYNRLNGAKKQWASLIESSTSTDAKEKSNVPLAGLSVLGRDY